MKRMYSAILVVPHTNGRTAAMFLIVQFIKQKKGGYIVRKVNLYENISFLVMVVGLMDTKVCVQKR